MKKFDDFDEDIMAGKVGHAEFIPVVSKDEEDFLLKDNVEESMPLLPMRENVLFPGVVLPIAAGRSKSVRLLKDAHRKNLKIVVAAQANKAEEPTMDDIYKVGVVAHVLKVFDLPNGTTMGIVQGTQRVTLTDVEVATPYNRCSVVMNAEVERPRMLRSKVSELRKGYAEVLKAKDVNSEVADSLQSIGSDKVVVNFVCSQLDISTKEKQSLLEAESYPQRLEMLLGFVSRELRYLSVRGDVEDKAKKAMDRQQREYFLNQQMRVIQDELGGSPTQQDCDDLYKRSTKKRWDDDMRRFFNKEMEKLSRMMPQSADYTVQLNYLNTLLNLPWNDLTKDDLRPTHARRVLNADHYGIEKLKERILEHIAVLKLKGDMKSPILCLVGPPGTGKTSLGKSIAAALGRKYVRMALGGLHDEAEVRGHRRTYVGAMPGRVIQNVIKAGTSNPVFILDEIDKVQTNTMHGDPTSALLEVLDPEQNNAFHDNYLDIDYDLSKVMFIATANSLSNIQPALLDRMEVIELTGYILEEKLEIAKRHLVPKQLSECGFPKDALTFKSDVLTAIINDYTRESGVRQLEKTIAKIIRRKAVEMTSGKTVDPLVRKEELKEMLGLPIHTSERRGKEPKVGVVTGLAWTQVGGEILFIESSISKGKGTLSMTGNLGDVMKESATLAFEYLKANADAFGVDQESIENSNLHIHVPEGATPKDGPSAGITMFVAMVSAFTRRRVKSNFAMTGEITLRGAVTPVGGIKEKILAAKRAEITDIILSEDNRRDIEDVKPEYLKGLTFHYIHEMSEALALVLE